MFEIAEERSEVIRPLKEEPFSPVKISQVNQVTECNNNGELVFPYGKEDTDYNIDGLPSSGYVFNGATSTFWCRLRDLLPSEIRNTFNSVQAECFSATNLINQFDAFQECYPEEIWRLDIERKYIRTFTGKSIDNSDPKLDVQYLRDMMQGRKKYQRRQWMRDQEIYFGTMNLMEALVGKDSNGIIFRCYTPVGDLAVPPNYNLKIVPYSDMYVSVQFGNGGTQQVRAKAGQEYTLVSPLSKMDDTQIVIYGGNRIQALSDLSAFYITSNNFSMATKLRKLVIGSPIEGYNNPKFTSLTLGDNKLLEELDLRNCGNLTGSLNLSTCSDLVKLLAEGTRLTGVTFATNGNLQIAHLPNTINTLTMRHLNKLTDFQASLLNLETLTLQGGLLNSYDLVSRCINSLAVLYLYDIDWSVYDTSLLNKIAALFYSDLTGRVVVDGQIRQQEIYTYNRLWDDLTLIYDPENIISQYKITFVNADNTVLYEEYIDRGSVPEDPVATGKIPAPSLAPDAQYTYRYIGWEDIEHGVLYDKTIVAKYEKTVRQYTVTWYAKKGGEPLGSVVTTYGSEVTYGGDIPYLNDDENLYIYKTFKGWDKSTGYVRGDIDVFAKWNIAEIPRGGQDPRDLNTAEIYGLCVNRMIPEIFSERDRIAIKMGKDYDFSNVESHVLADELYLDGNTVVDTGIKLFAEDSPTFTMAIDFEFSETTKANQTLFGCFDEDGSEGFRVRYNSTVNLQWGSGSHNVTNTTWRNIIVIRHEAGSTELKINLFDSSTSTNTYDDNTYYAIAERNRETITDRTLTFGGIKIGNGEPYDYAKGFIHWCKIWYDDLGYEACKELASWTHETLEFDYIGTELYRLAGSVNTRANGSFIAAQTLYKYHHYNPTYTNVGGWGSGSLEDGYSSGMRSFLNKKFFKGLPYDWQFIIRKTRVLASAGNQSPEIVPSDDYIYLPAIKELNDLSTTTPYKDESEFIIPWYNTTSNAANGFTHIYTCRVKFKYAIPEDAKCYISPNDPTYVADHGVKYGDIWYDTSTNNTYIYITDDLIDKYNLQNKTQDGIRIARLAYGTGGWVQGDLYGTRSPVIGNNTQFYAIGRQGANGAYYGSGPGGMLPCFSI